MGAALAKRLDEALGGPRLARRRRAAAAAAAARNAASRDKSAQRNAQLLESLGLGDLLVADSSDDELLDEALPARDAPVQADDFMNVVTGLGSRTKTPTPILNMELLQRGIQ